MSRMPGFSAQNTLYSSTGRYRSHAGGGVFSGLVEPSFPFGPRYLSKDFINLSSLLSHLCCLNMNLNKECVEGTCYPLPGGQCTCLPYLGGGKQGEE